MAQSYLELSPSSCYSPQAIRSFLRLSRKTSDDSLITALRRYDSCEAYLNTVLYREWNIRDHILAYCQHVAEGRSPPPPSKSLTSSETNTQVVAQNTDKKAIDPRFDPYGARDLGHVSDTKEDIIKDWVRKERSVEEIIRENTISILADKCLGSTSSRLSMDPNSFYEAYRAFQKNL